MTTYDNVITRSDSQALVPEEVSKILLKNIPDQSAALSLSLKTRMSTNQTRMPVLAALPIAYFVNGDTGLKKTTKTAWANKYLNVEELAAIVPIPEAVLDDTNFGIWADIRPKMETAVGRALDAAIFFGTNKPASWPTALHTAIAAAGHSVTRGTANAAAGGIAEDINQVMGKVEDDGYDVNGFVTARNYRKRLRGARDTTGQKLLDVSTNEIEGEPVKYALRGQWPTGSGSPELFAGDWNESIIGLRQDFTYKILDQAVLQDDTGAIIYNLAQQDMVAMRLVFRVAWQVGNTLNYDNPDEATRYPWAELVAP
jgi:HK97 family phage major capsid protein